MDLISINRMYNKRRNILIFISIFILIAYLFLGWHFYVQENIKNKIFNVYFSQIEVADQIYEEIARQKELERLAKLPNLTEVGFENMNNIYQSESKRVFLTFDDGPSQTVTIPILDLLKEEKIKATFFVLGSRVDLYPEIVKRTYDEGHFIANHGYSHVYSQIYSSTQSVLDEYNKTNDAVRVAIGEPEYNSHLFRFPGGLPGGKYSSIKKQAKQLLNENGIVNIDWNCLTGDAEGKKTTEQFITEIDKTAPKYNSVVVLMHDTAAKSATYNALPQIISYFRERGYEFTTFYDIIK